MLELREIYKYYNPGTVNEMCLFNNFNFKVDDGEFVAVVGSNGSGKTSMLNIICGSILIDEGAVLINGTNITNMPEYKRMGRIGRVFQNPSMGTCPSMTILENMAMAENKGKAYNLGKGVNKKEGRASRVGSSAFCGVLNWYGEPVRLSTCRPSKPHFWSRITNIGKRRLL